MRDLIGVLLLYAPTFSRLVEEVKDMFSVEMQNEDLFMNPNFMSFASTVVGKIRGGDQNGKEAVLDYRAVEVSANKMKLRFPCQLFINGEFVDAESGLKLPVINPADEKMICEVGFLTFIQKLQEIFINGFRCSIFQYFLCIVRDFHG